MVAKIDLIVMFLLMAIIITLIYGVGMIVYGYAAAGRITKANVKNALTNVGCVWVWVSIALIFIAFM